MARFLMSVCYPAGSTAPDPEQLAEIERDIAGVHDALAARGEWVFGGGLHGPDTATVVSMAEGTPVMTDGPFIDTKEVIGGFSVIDVADLDTALQWAQRLSAATTCPIEVRPFLHSTVA